jgi:hypothetical protein
MLKYMLNYDVKEAGFTSLLTPPEGIDDPQHPKGTSAFKPGYSPGLQGNQATRWAVL